MSIDIYFKCPSTGQTHHDTFDKNLYCNDFYAQIRERVLPVFEFDDFELSYGEHDMFIEPFTYTLNNEFNKPTIGLYIRPNRTVHVVSDDEDTSASAVHLRREQRQERMQLRREHPSLITSSSLQTLPLNSRNPRCCICMEQEPTIVFLPCYHVCTCSTCSQNTRVVTNCPICRVRITHRNNIYFA